MPLRASVRFRTPSLPAAIALVALTLAVAGCGRQESTPAAGPTPEPAPGPAPGGPMAGVPTPSGAPALPPSVGHVNVMGRDLVLPPPPGMTVVPLENTQTPGGAVLARFVPDSTIARWQAQPGPRGTRVLAIATALADMNKSETSAAETVERLRATPPGALGDPKVEALWSGALREGLAGHPVPLPPHPGTPGRVARLDPPPGVFSEILLESSGGRRGVAATAVVLVKDRAVLLYVGMQEPQVSTELAALERVIIGWVSAFQNANRV